MTLFSEECQSRLSGNYIVGITLDHPSPPIASSNMYPRENNDLDQEALEIATAKNSKIASESDCIHKKDLEETSGERSSLDQECESDLGDENTGGFFSKSLSFWIVASIIVLLVLLVGVIRYIKRSESPKHVGDFETFQESLLKAYEEVDKAKETLAQAKHDSKEQASANIRVELLTKQVKDAEAKIAALMPKLSEEENKSLKYLKEHKVAYDKRQREKAANYLEQWKQKQKEKKLSGSNDDDDD